VTDRTLPVHKNCPDQGCDICQRDWPCARLARAEHDAAAKHTDQDLSSASRIMIAVTHLYQEHGGDPPARAVAAAALRAAADQVAPDYACKRGSIYGDTMRGVRSNLLDIAAKLEAEQ
jgi:hypothetical protein